MYILKKCLDLQKAHWHFAALLAMHVIFLGWSAYRHSPTQDEVAHLPAGLVIWRHQDFSVYRVNPPLVRIVAATPVLLVKHEEDWRRYRKGITLRQEWALGRDFIRANGTDSFWIFTLARLCCIPFSLVGMTVCYRWGTELFGPKSGRLAAALWCFSPSVIGHGSLITPDIAATSLGLLAAWRFSKWLELGSFRNAFLSGGALGLALLTKSYWITLLGIWPVIWFVRRCFCREQKGMLPQLVQLGGILLVGINLLNLGYLFEGTGTPLKSYDFYSSSLSGKLRFPGKNFAGNRFTGTWLGEIPVPLPKDYVTGIDIQKVDFERGKWSYFWGEVKEPGGWWQYYLVGLFLKVPVGTWVLFCLGMYGFQDFEMRSKIVRLTPLILPAILLFLIASSQTSMNRHVRYVFALLPVIYLVAAASVQYSKLAIICLSMTILSNCLAYPHSLSFFNRLVGGPDHGHRYLIDSNLDWGQDMLYVKEWLEKNPEKRPVFIGWGGDISVRSLGIDADYVSMKTLEPGWYLISRSERYNPNQRLKIFETMQPVNQIGYTYDVYHIKQQIKNPMLPYYDE